MRNQKLIVRARIVATAGRPAIENGAVAISANRVADVGAFPEIAAGHGGVEIIDLGEQALLPGLINAHCHLEYTCLRGKIPRPTTFTKWVRAINTAKTELSPEDYLASTHNGFSEAQKFGTTTIANLTGFPELAASVRAPVRTWWFPELIDVRNPERANEIVDVAVKSMRTGSTRAGVATFNASPVREAGHLGALAWGLAPHAPFTASVNLQRRCVQIARSENILLTTHLAESRDEMMMFRDANGPLYEFLSELGRDMSDCGRGTPLERFVASISDQSLPWIIAHLNELAETDFDLLRISGTPFSVVHCPRSHDYFGHSPFPFENLKKLEFPICLGTDSLASNDDLSLFAEMREFLRNFPAVSPEEIFSMATKNAAAALGQQSLLGEIRPGALADLIAVPLEARGDIFEQVIASSITVTWSMIDGVVQKPT
jgi:cytosine/adenosine deaminase-related metal-dependent hydrolase